MSTNELPSNMGKKIADALKKQNKPLNETEEIVSGSEIEETVLEQNNPSDYNSDEQQESGNSAYEDLDLYDTPSVDIDRESEDYAPIFKMDTGEVSDNPDFKLSIDAEEETEEFEMPNNINVLKRLIAQLPTGVSKQTGAQIIRQTIEALGIPMKSVLQDAQRVRECLNSSIKDCNFTIQEYKSNIRNLEKQSLNYQKQLDKLNDIIGLFVYTDKK